MRWSTLGEDDERMAVAAALASDRYRFCVVGIFSILAIVMIFKTILVVGRFDDERDLPTFDDVDTLPRNQK
jgi:hypothetical protein